MSTFVSYALNDYTPAQITTISGLLQSMGMPSSLATEFENSFKVMQELDYHLIKINSTITLNESVRICAYTIWQYMLDYLLVLQEFETNAILLTKLKPEQINSMAYGHIVDTTDSKRNMSEDAPISSGATLSGDPNYTIDTPRERYNADNTSNETHSGTDTETKNNPYYWETYIRLLVKYNISKIIKDSIRYCTEEYQSNN